MTKNNNSKRFKLVIVESPSKAKTIAHYLGNEYKVVASKGHILDLPKKSLGIDLDTFKTELVPIENKGDTIKEIIKLSKDASEVYLASDPDREGEAIAFHLKQIIKRKDAKRVLFHSVTKKAVVDAIKNASELDSLKHDAQQARRILDRLIGYKISPVLWDKLPGDRLSAGRVQSVALKIVVKRENEIVNFVPEKWFDILAKFKKDDIEFTSKFIGENKDKPSKIKDGDSVKKIIEVIKDKEFNVSDLDKKDREVAPQPPFTTSKLQQEASIKLKFKSKQTMQLAQKLYEGIDLGGGVRTGLITYMRTDSVRSDPDFVSQLRKLIVEYYGEKYLSKETIVHKQKKGSDSKVQDAHEAIRPTNLDLPPNKVRDALSGDEWKLYSLIWNKFVASQMASSKSLVSTVTMEVSRYYFKASGSILVFDGFKKVASNLTDRSGSEGDTLLPKLEKGEKLLPIKPPYFESKSSSPPARYNEGTLVKELEENGIGRPSTYAAIISNISDRLYVTTNTDGRFVPTDLGTNLCNFLEKHFPNQMDISFTSKNEELLDGIEEGSSDYKKVIKEFWTGLEKEIAKTKDIPSIEGSRDKKAFPKKYTKEICKLCSKRMTLIDTKKNKFLSCEDYPKCKFTMSIPSNVSCPKCKEGKLSKRTKKDGSEFLGCTSYPKCDFVIWNSTIFKKCKFCDGEIIIKDDKKQTCYKCKKEQK